MPTKNNQRPRQPKPLYRQKMPKAKSAQEAEFHHPHVLTPAHFALHDDGTIAPTSNLQPATSNPSAPAPTPNSSTPQLLYTSEQPFLRLYHGNCLELLDAIAAKYPEGRFDAIFADPPYFLSNGGITCHAGRMVKVDKGDWDKSQGPEVNHEFNLEWLRRCQRVLKPNGTLWVSGTHHVIFSIGYAMQQLGYKILNDIAWEKPNPPPNLSCRYFIPHFAFPPSAIIKRKPLSPTARRAGWIGCNFDLTRIPAEARITLVQTVPSGIEPLNQQRQILPGRGNPFSLSPGESSPVGYCTT